MIYRNLLMKVHIAPGPEKKDINIITELKSKFSAKIVYKLQFSIYELQVQTHLPSLATKAKPQKLSNDSLTCLTAFLLPVLWSMNGITTKVCHWTPHVI
jgi:hypothetical protein